MTTKTLLKHLRADADRLGSRVALALAIGISKGYLSDVLLGKRQPGPTILRYYGLEVAPVRYVGAKGKRIK